MSARIFAISFITLLIWTQSLHSACPTNLVEVAPDICMLVIRSKGSFCEAHKLCETEGQTRGMQLFVPGRNAQLIPAIVPPSSIVFTGISAFLNRSLNNREGWRYADPGSSSDDIDASDTSIPWNHGEPNDIYGSIAPFYSLNLQDGLQLNYQSTHVVCQMSHDQVNAPMEIFKQNWPYPISPLLFAHSHAIGCFTFTNESTMVACSLR
ncbi:hypothetical protein FGIG_07383 [Fasciola gigantica]|uniref:C-type lectin domain-containing protein n=1 Tax=Fasciola gigantica TaxID=46835 RepID=A0A504Z9B0_FASGI|nr:hypothetical protein FGIG_07383 [Fasciola gigantica]